MIKKLFYAIPIIIFLNSVDVDLLLSIFSGTFLVYFLKGESQELFIKRFSYVLAVLEFSIYYQKGIINKLSVLNELIRGVVGVFI